MSKIQKKFSVAAKGILDIHDGVMSVENEETGELVSLSDLCAEFADKDISFSMSYNEDYE